MAEEKLDEKVALKKVAKERGSRRGRRIGNGREVNEKALLIGPLTLLRYRL